MDIIAGTIQMIGANRRLWRAALLGGAAIGALSVGPGRAALADTACVISGGGTIATCVGDQSDGISQTAPVTTLNVLNLTGDITPASGVDGISFISGGAVTIDSFTGYHDISVSGVGADGIVAQSTAGQPVNLSHVGDITTTDGYGVYATGWADVSTTTVSRINSGGDGLHIESFVAGDVTIQHAGSINSANGSGIYATANGGINSTTFGDIHAYTDGIHLTTGNPGPITLSHSGDITSDTGYGVYATANLAISSTTSGDIDAYLDGIHVTTGTTGTVTIEHTGNIGSETGYGVYATANLAISSTTSGDIDAYEDAIHLSTGTTGTVTIQHTGNLRSETGYGVYATANQAISSTTSGDIDAYDDAIHLSTGTTGTVTIQHTGDLASESGYGIYATSNAGISSTSAGDISAYDDGIHLVTTTTTSTLTVDHTGHITSATGYGIDAYASNGPVSITAAGGIHSSLAGIHVVNPTGTFVTVAQNGSITSDTEQGIYVSASVGAVTITGSGDIQAAGDGIYAWSGGSATPITITRSGDIDAGGLGISALATTGVVTVTNGGDIESTWDGIYAVSKGNDTDAIIDQTGDVTSQLGNGLYAWSTDGDATVTSVGDISAAQIGISALATGNVTDATVDHTGDIGSANSYGVFAKSTTGDAVVTVTGDIDAWLDGIYAYATGDTGTTVSVTHTGGITSTTGNGIYAFATTGAVDVSNIGDIDAALAGIYATSVSDQTMILSQVGEIVARGGDGIYGQTINGLIDASVDGDVTASEDGIHLKSFNDIDLTIDGGTITGGAGYAGVYFEQGLTNSLTNYGTIRSADGIGGLAVLSENNDTTIDNYGLVIGSVDLYEWSNAFNNHAGALFEAGPLVDLGEWNYLTNDGTFSPGGQDNVITTALTGAYVNSPGSTFLVDVDMDGSTADLVEATDSADLSGRLWVNLISFDAGPQTFTIFTTGDAVTTQDLQLAQPVLLADITYPGDNQVDLTILGVDFNPEGLDGNAGAVGDHLTQAFYAGSPGLEPLFQGMLNLGTTAQVQDALEQLTPGIFLSSLTADLYGGLDFADSLMSCKVAGGVAAFGAEGQCGWARLRYDRLEQDGSDDGPGFTQDTGEFSAGAQFAGAGDWRFGFALGAAFVRLDGDESAQSSDGTRVEGGVVAKYVPGPWLFAAALSGTYGWYDSSREVDFGGFSDELSGDPEIGTLNGRLRAAYTAGGDSVYVRPQVDLNATLVSLSGFTESGGAAAMSIDGQTDTIVSLAPAVEVGGQTAFEDGTVLRGFLRAGIDWFMDPELEVTGAFANAGSGAGDFTISSSPDDVLWTVSAGVDVFTTGGLTVRAAYDGKFGETTTDNAVSLKVSLDF